MNIKIGDRVTINEPQDFNTLMVILTCMADSYEVLGIGTPPDGWPSNEGCSDDAVYFFDDKGTPTQLEHDDVTLVQ